MFQLVMILSDLAFFRVWGAPEFNTLHLRDLHIQITLTSKSALIMTSSADAKRQKSGLCDINILFILKYFLWPLFLFLRG